MRVSTLCKEIRAAVKYGDFSKFDTLVTNGIPPQVIDRKFGREGNTLLHQAIGFTNTRPLKLLIEANASPNLTNKKGETPLLVSFQKRSYAKSRLLADAGACIDPEYEAEHANELRLWTAVLRGDLDELRRRIDDGDSVDQAPQGGKAKGWTALWLAVALDREDAARMLIQAGADVNARHQNGCSLLLIALDYRRLKIAKLLVQAHADVNEAAIHPSTPLYLAAHLGDCDMVKMLLDAGANVNTARLCKSTALHAACYYGHFEVARMLIDAGANVQLRDSLGKSPLHYLLYKSDVNVVNTSIRELFTLLTDAGAKVNGATAKISPLVPSDVIRAIVPKNTPVWLAANNDAPMLALELAGGLDPNMKTENGMTLLHWACAGDAPECVQLLLDAGADLSCNIEDFEGYYVEHTPIYYCMHDTSECLECIISAGVDIKKFSKFDGIPRHPLKFAVAVNSPACVTALVGAGAAVPSLTIPWFVFSRSLELALKLRPTPVDALRALLATADDQQRNTWIHLKPSLYWAVENCSLSMVRILVEEGVNLNQKYENYENVLQFAQKRFSKPASSAESSRLTALIDYLKSLPCFSEEQ